MMKVRGARAGAGIGGAFRAAVTSGGAFVAGLAAWADDTGWTAAAGNSRSHANHHMKCAAKPDAIPGGVGSSHGVAANKIETTVTKLGAPFDGLRCARNTTSATWIVVRNARTGDPMCIVMTVCSLPKIRRINRMANFRSAEAILLSPTAMRVPRQRDFSFRRGRAGIA
jgi:hypothetical protein